MSLHVSLWNKLTHYKQPSMLVLIVRQFRSKIYTSKFKWAMLKLFGIHTSHCVNCAADVNNP